MKTIALKRLHLVTVPKGTGMTPARRVVLQAELAKMGYRLTNPELLEKASDTFFLDYGDCVRTLQHMRGGDVAYVPLFTGFPDQVPDDDEYFAQRIVGYLGNAFQMFPDGITLENGMVVPRWLFDVGQFGADPISQMQTKTLWQRAKEKMGGKKADAHVEWIDLRLVWADEVEGALQEWLEHVLFAKSSVREELHPDVAEVMGVTGVGWLDFEQVVMKETRALVLKLFWQADRLDEVAQLATGPTDVLRLFAALTETDVSLAGPIRFPKLSRKQRRLVLQILESAGNLAEDLQRYRGLWLELGRYAHPGEYQNRYPRTAQAFDALRNGKVETFAGRTETLMRRSEAGSVLAHLSKRPGELGRKVHELMRRFPQRSEAIEGAFGKAATRMTVKNLLVLKAYFASINEQPFRTVINKRGKIKVLPNNALRALSAEQLDGIRGVIEGALVRQLATRESWEGKTVWVDPQLARYTVPLQQRAASDGLLAVGRGSRLVVDLDKVLRLFVYWKQTARRTDLDLSVIQFDEAFNYVGHVSYTNLASGGIVHSGDLQSAPHGAAEFVDITLKKVDPNTRYLATQVYRYAGEGFAQMQCHAGWMVRSKVDGTYKSFDLKTVSNKFDLNGTGGYCVPHVVDLEKGEIIMTDLYMGAKAFHNNVEGAYGNVAMAAREIANFTETRPTMKGLAELHVAARGGTLVGQVPADITFGLSDCTYNASDVEGVLSNLL